MTSLWNSTADDKRYPPLSDRQSADVAVIGGGIAGLTAALYLAEAGRSVAVLEAREVGAGVTGGSTGKVTSQHGLIYAGLAEAAGPETATSYAEANQWAVEEVHRLVTEHAIECDYERRDAYLVAQSEECSRRLEDEQRAAQEAGLPAALTADVPTAQPVRAGLLFPDQAQIHPRRYVAGLAAAVERAGGSIYERSTVRSVDRKGRVCAETDGGSLVADDMVVATNLPFLDGAGYFARAYPRAHVGIAARLEAEAAPAAMFYCIDGAPHSYRSWNSAAGTYLVAISESFTPGHPADVAGIADRLAKDVARHWPTGEAEYRWVTEDYHSADRRPFAGRLTPLSRHIYTATGFGGWGLTNATAAARLIADMILGRQARWADLYATGRLRSTVTERFLKRNAHVAQHWMEGRLSSGERRSPSDLDNGDGAVLQTDEGKRAVYRDADGSFHAFSPYCPHMQCLLSWNNLDRTWDCACHGSRFGATGALLHGPATTDLQWKPLS